MNKEEYLDAIRGRISAMPADDINRFMDYYSEMIDDRMEDGLSEDEAVADMGSPDAAVEQILEEMPLTKLVKEKIKPKHELKAWEVVLIVLGSPVWIPSYYGGGIAAYSVDSCICTSYFILRSCAQLCGGGNMRTDMHHTTVHSQQPVHSSPHAWCSAHRHRNRDTVCCIG